MTDLAELLAGAADARAAAPRVAPTRPHVGLRTASRWFALAATEVIEVVAAPAVTRVPAAPPHVLGLAMLRGRLLPVIDLELLVTGRATPRLEHGRAIVARHGDVEVAIVAVATRGLIELADGDVDGDAAAAAPGGERPAWIAREVAAGDALFAVIDAAALIARALGSHA